MTSATAKKKKAAAAPKTSKATAKPAKAAAAPAPAAAAAPPPAKKAAKKPKREIKELTGKRVAFYGEFSVWPTYHRAKPATIATRVGANVVEAVDESLDVLVLGDMRGEGRAEAKKKGDKLAQTGKLKILDEAAFRELVRIDLKGKRFAFTGGFDCSPDEANDKMLQRMVENVGGIVDADITAELDYLVRGARKGDKKIARLNLAEKLNKESGAEIDIIEEGEFLQLVRTDAPLKPAPGAAGAAGAADASGATTTTATTSSDFAGFMTRMYGIADSGKLGRALTMLKGGSFKLYSKLDEARLVGVVKSQTGSGEVYAPWLKPDGSYGCCKQDLDECMGLQGTVCKHLLVLVVGLTRTNVMQQQQALDWVKAARSKRPRMNADLCAETLLQYKGAEAGTVDWRPTETIPEDFMAL